jgi:CRISPR/Cas system-associated exonuclease Cas4 (RecB family)
LDTLINEFGLRDNFRLAIENNSYGNQIVERLLLTNKYHPFVIKTVKKNGRVDYGINTNRETKREMVNLFYESVVSDPKIINSEDLISELFNIEYKSNGKIEATKGYHDDLFMASCLAFYGAHILKERRELPPKIIYHLDKELYELSQREEEQIKELTDDIVRIFKTGNYQTNDVITETFKDAGFNIYDDGLDIASIFQQN